MSFFDFLKRKEKRDGKESPPAPPPTAGQASGAKEKYNFSSLVLGALGKPHITERSRDMSHQGAYVFRVLPFATKPMVKEAVEALYRITVDAVRMMRVPPKPRRRGLTRGTKKGYKKAIVVLRAGQRIEEL
ncbi:MAG: 50S ribosomal protein L23 [Patescibacteria group bacterium]